MVVSFLLLKLESAVCIVLNDSEPYRPAPDIAGISRAFRFSFSRLTDYGLSGEESDGGGDSFVISVASAKTVVDDGSLLCPSKYLKNSYVDQQIAAAGI